MDYREAFNKTLEMFEIRASDLSERSGVDPSRLSKFRNGHHDLRSGALANLINALPSDARAYYYLLVMSNGSSPVASGR